MQPLFSRRGTCKHANRVWPESVKRATGESRFGYEGVLLIYCRTSRGGHLADVHFRNTPYALSADTLLSYLFFPPCLLFLFVLRFTFGDIYVCIVFCANALLHVSVKGEREEIRAPNCFRVIGVWRDVIVFVGPTVFFDI